MMGGLGNGVLVINNRGVSFRAPSRSFSEKGGDTEAEARKRSYF